LCCCFLGRIRQNWNRYCPTFFLFISNMNRSGKKKIIFYFIFDLIIFFLFYFSFSISRFLSLLFKYFFDYCNIEIKIKYKI
jgi:hypothetical protein